MGKYTRSYESEFYTKLIEEFSLVKDNSSRLELLRSNKIRELTEIFCETKDTTFYQQAMQIVLSLFTDDSIHPISSPSKRFQELNEEKRETLISILQNE